MDIRDAVKRLAENMETATRLLKGQAKILEIHDRAISTITTDLEAANVILKGLNGYALSVDAQGKVIATAVPAAKK